MTSLKIRGSEIAGVHIIERQPVVDGRGWLERMYCDSELEEILGSKRIRQINRSLTKYSGTVRGLHFQRAPKAEVKLVSCIRGKVFDVAVDLRVGSPTFLKWHGEVLDASNRRTLVIPEGFAHGFQALSSDCELLYFHTAEFDPEAEVGINAKDGPLKISWPLPVAGQSKRDEQLQFVDDVFLGLIA